MKRTNSIGSLFLAILLLAGSIGATKHTHYCMGKVRDVAINGVAEACSMDRLAMERGENSMCCSETLEEFQIDDLTQVTFSYDIPDLFVSEWVSFANALLLTPILEAEKPEYLNYKPPLIDQDIPVQIQSFLL